MNTQHLFIRTLRKFKFLRYLNLTSTIEVNKQTYKIPLQAGFGLDNLFMSEPWMTRLLEKLKPFFTGAFVDVGVNIGQTLIKAHSVNKNVNYIGFEPNAVCVHYVQELIKLNNIKNCKLIPVGVNDQSGVLKLNFFYSDETDSTASIIDNFRPGESVDHFNYVPVFEYRHLQSLLPEIGHCILKIDVEGAELEVLKTFGEWIMQCQPLIILEILPVYKPDNHFRLSRQHEIEKLLNSWNYQMSRVNKKGEIRLTKISEIGVHGDLDNCDYVLYPIELEPGLRSILDAKTETKTLLKEGIPVGSNMRVGSEV